MDPELDRIFHDEGRRRVREMVKALREHRGDSLWRHAHSLKGAAGTVGARRVEELARGIAEEVRDPEGRPRVLSAEAEERLRERVGLLQAEFPDGQA